MARRMRARFCFLSNAVLLLCLTLDGGAQRPAGSRRALTIEDYYRIKTIGDAQIPLGVEDAEWQMGGILGRDPDR